MRFALKRGPECLCVEVAGREIPVAVTRNARARRLILRLDSASGQPIVTLPARTALAEGERFLLKNIGWLEQRLARAADAAPFKPGRVFPFRGKPCRIVYRGGRGLVRLDRDEGGLRLSVPGEREHIARRVSDWLKRTARRDFERAVARHAETLGKQPAAIRIGDPKSRWGSCSARRVLAFSWRLVLAPPYVLDYLAAHEVAHLAHMNHGPKFWATVARLDPDYEAAQLWLRQHGAALHAVGRQV
jgi:predicted metal-dependent hydrolase